jgi:hypothetical protein
MRGGKDPCGGTLLLLRSPAMRVAARAVLEEAILATIPNVRWTPKTGRFISFKERSSFHVLD